MFSIAIARTRETVKVRVVLAVSPCEAFLPVYLTAVPYGWWGVALLSGVLAFAALGGMLLLTSLVLAGWQRLIHAGSNATRPVSSARSSGCWECSCS